MQGLRATAEFRLRKAAGQGKGADKSGGRKPFLAAITKLKSEGYAPAFIAKLVTIAKAMFRVAVRRGILNKSPLEYIPAGSQVNKARNQFIPAETVRALLAVLPDAEWRLAVALAPGAVCGSHPSCSPFSPRTFSGTGTA
jgi:hypothetical protein